MHELITGVLVSGMGCAAIWFIFIIFWGQTVDVKINKNLQEKTKQLKETSLSAETTQDDAE